MADLQQLKHAIARVEGLPQAAASTGATAAAGATPGAGGVELGTAFYVGNGFALSALHVVADIAVSPARPRYPGLALNFTEAGHVTRAEIVAQDLADDWVVLRCADPPPVTPIVPAPHPAKGASWECFGYPKNNLEGMVIDGDITDPGETDPGNAAKTPAIQLFCKQAGAGTGMPLHGFSGAPCLVDGKAIGLMRSTMLGTALDGTGREMPVTVGGIGFVCPAWRVAERGAPLDRIALPGGWSRPPADSDFIVITSSAEARASHKLISVARSAYEDIGERTALAPPESQPAEVLIASDEALRRAVRMLCRARVAIFDATGFEPAVMLLLGLRAAVRRGVTILSIGGSKYMLGDSVEIPFNLMDANFVSHSEKQDSAGDEDLKRVGLLRGRIERGLKAIAESPHYADLPVYEAVRQLPAHRRGVRSRDSGVLVLCSFKKGYSSRNWKNLLKPALGDSASRLSKSVKNPAAAIDALGVARSLELKAPQLVSRAIYEEIRRAQACVVDLTGWEPAVIFELGVRLAVSQFPVGCLIEEGSPNLAGLDAQCERIKAMFVPPEQRYRCQGADYLTEEALRIVYGPQARLPDAGPASGVVYRWVSEELQVDAEPSARPAYLELLDSARIFAKGADQKPVGLYPANRRLAQQEAAAQFERLAGAALLLSQRFEDDAKLLADATAGPAISEAVKTLFADQDMLERLQSEWPELFRRLDRVFELVVDTGGGSNG